MKYYRNRQNELITVHEIKFVGNWLEELNDFIGEYGKAEFNKEYLGVNIYINDMWIFIKENTHLIKTKEGIRIVPDFELIGDL